MISSRHILFLNKKTWNGSCFLENFQIDKEKNGKISHFLLL